MRVALRTIGLLLGLALISFAPLPAQADEPLRFEYLTVEDGLSNSAVMFIMQDSQGFMWFGTQDGLNKYDGYTVTVYRHTPDNPNSLSNNVVMAGYEDKEGALWFGTDPGGLNRFDRTTGRFTVYTHDPQNPDSISNDAVWAIYEDHLGMLWLGTRDGLNRFDRTTGKFKSYKPDPANPRSLSYKDVIHIYEDKEGTLWIGTRDGLNKFDRETEQFTVYKHDPANPHSLSNNQTWAIYQDRAGTLWIGTRGGGLNKFDPKTEQFTAYQSDPDNPATLSGNNIWSITEDSQGYLWLGLENAGLNKFDPKTGQVTRYPANPDNPASLSHANVFEVYRDRAGAIWAATWGGGVNRLDLGLQRFTLYQHIPGDPNSLSANFVNAIYQDQAGVLWIGTQNGGLNRFDRAANQMTHYQNAPQDSTSLSANTVNFIHEDRAGVLWVGTMGGGLNKFDRASEKFTSYKNDPNNPATLASNNLTQIYEDGSGALWIGTLGFGLDKFDPATGQVTHYRHDPNDPHSLAEDTINVLYGDHAGDLWIGTFRAGLDKFEAATGKFNHYQFSPADPNSLSNNNVRSIYEDPEGVFWIGTSDGLNKFNPATGQFSHYHMKDGLPSSTIYGILADTKGNLWLSTGQGLARFDPQAETFRNYDVLDGLQSNQFNPYSYYQSREGQMFFGGPGGLTAFYPEQIRDNPYLPSIVLTGFLLFNQVVPVGDDSPLAKPINELEHLILTYDQSVFSFEFAALNYHIAQKNLYRYKLAGFDQDWSPASPQRLATYTNLDAGHYTFMVKASNNDGLWNETPKTIRLTILPPWWETPWFSALVVLAIAGSVLAGFQWRISSIKARNRELERRVRERTLELRLSNEQLQQEISQRIQAEANLLKAKEVAEQAKASAETASQAKSIFLATMSHELRTPLNSILGYAQILKRDLTLPRQRDGLNVIQQSGEHLLGLINDVLDIAKVEAGKIELHPTDFHLPSFVQTVSEIIRVRAENKSLYFKVETDPALPQAIYADEQRLRQVLINLLGNAIRYTDKGEVTFRVSVVGQDNVKRSNVERSDITLRFTVIDTGIGIAPEHLEMIFEPFKQVSEIGHKGEGAGLGLAISRNLIKLMGGELGVTSEPGRGSTFWFELTVPLAAHWSETIPFNTENIIGVKGQPPRILVVDDKPQNRRVLVDMLSPLGFEVMEADNGLDGWVKVGQGPFQAIITDLIMPEWDGFAFIQKIRQSPEFKEVIIIASSASVYEDDRRKSLEAGADAFVPKPVHIDTLLETLQQHLHLEWRYTDTQPLPGPTSAGKPGEVTLPAELLAQLTELVTIGDIRGLRQQAIALQQDECLKPFGLELEQLATGFQMDKIRAMLKAYQS
ncbi:MAG: histidine kinase [Anaerolineae bacterium]|nr:histidine kinase [Anaerolineae bacterium]